MYVYFILLFYFNFTIINVQKGFDLFNKLLYFIAEYDGKNVV